ncbi:MAG TPA: YhjD/YihY/BrkB family envelope integrity protein, partial [Chryseosolibacter sp.]|nr:YhjD/YihY/BrkB family envelope integrity protein [Chryseosolibacter sp.]
MGKLSHLTKGVWATLKQSFAAFGDIDPFNKSIVISYYTIFSLPGLLVIIINIAGYFFGTEAVTGQITAQIGGMIGGDTANEMERIIANATQSKGT